MKPELIYAALRHLVDEVIFASDEARRIVFVTPSVQTVLGWTEAEFTAFRTWELVHPDDREAARIVGDELRTGIRDHYRMTLRVRHADGGWRWCDIVGRYLVDDELGGVVGSLRDVSDRRELEERLRAQAVTDELTSLANRRGFLAELEAALDAPGAAHCGLLCLDLDGFKAVNDRHGHPAGDALLERIGARLRETLRPGDLAGRMGGDEFAVLCRRVTAPGDGVVVAERIVEALSGPWPLGEGAAVDVGVSVGVADARPGEDVAALVRRADEALYAAKDAGRGRVRRAP